MNKHVAFISPNTVNRSVRHHFERVHDVYVGIGEGRLKKINTDCTAQCRLAGTLVRPRGDTTSSIPERGSALRL